MGFEKKLTIIFFLSTIYKFSLAGTPEQDRRCGIVYHVKNNIRGQCNNNNHLECSCLCDPSAEVPDWDSKCCPPSPFPEDDEQMFQTDNIDRKIPHCTLFWNFDCYKNLTEACRGPQIVLRDSYHYETFFLFRIIRSFLLSPGCKLLRQTLDSLCPFNNTELVLNESGNLDNLITISSENLWCQCEDQPSTTPRPSPPVINKMTYIIISAGISSLIFLTVLIHAWRRAVRKSKDEEQLLNNDVNEDPEPLPWKSFQPLRLISFIGQGTFGKVFKAEHNLTKRTLAIKRIEIFSVVDAYHPKMIQFLAEAQLLVQINNDHVVKLYNCWVENEIGNVVQGEEEHWFSEIVNKYSKNYWSSSKRCQENPDLDYVLFLQMEFCDNDLKKVIRAYETFEERDAFINFTNIIRHLISGLKALHNKNIIHRDIKPANILYSVNKLNSEKIWKIGDLGLSKENHPEAENSCEFVGTGLYMSPEMLVGECSESSDFFSLGLTLLEILCPSLLDKDKRKESFDVIRSTNAKQKENCLQSLLSHLPNNLVLEGNIVRQMLETVISLRVSVPSINVNY